MATLTKCVQASQKQQQRAQKAQQKAIEKEQVAILKKQQKVALKEAQVNMKAQRDAEALSLLMTNLRAAEGAWFEWYSKILSYEPIILEDFADFTGLEVDLIRDFFDREGVCCITKQTRAGKSRRRL